MSATNVGVGGILIAGLGLVLWSSLLSCGPEQATTPDAGVSDSLEAGSDDAGIVDAVIDDGGVPEPTERVLARFPAKHRGWQVRSHREGVRFLTWRHPEDWHLWVREVPLTGQMSFEVPSLVLATKWPGEPAFIEAPSSNEPASAVFLHGLNPQRYPSLYRVLLPDGAIHQLFSCEFSDRPLFSNAVEEGAFWVGVKRDCSLHCEGGASAFYGLRLDESGAARTLGPVCPLPDSSEPQSLLVHPSRQLALVVGFGPQEADAGIDTNLYVRFVSFDETGRTGMSSQFKPEKASQVAAGLFLPHRRAAIYTYADPSPGPGGPPPTVEEIRELLWSAEDEIVESVFEPANSLLREVLAIHQMDEQQWVLVGVARNPEDSQTPRLALHFDGDELTGTTVLRQVEGAGTIVSWRGEPFIFWKGPVAQDHETAEIWTRRLEFRPAE